MQAMINELLGKYPLISDQVNRHELRIILSELLQIIETETKGDIVEFGCYTGTTSLFIERLLITTTPKRSFHIYDSFLGLPAKNIQDSSPAGEQFKPGQLYASKQTLIQNFKKANLPLPTIHKGWFEDLSGKDLPEIIAFAFLDGDFYSSIHASLRLIETRLSKGACIVIDDYLSESLPGTQKAVDAWLIRNPVWKLRVVHGMAVMHDGSYAHH